MLRSVAEIHNYTLLAKDGAVGGIKDFYFDDRVWAVRYLVADTRKWLPGRRVLISPAAAGAPGWETETVPVNLTKDQIQNAPGLDEAEPAVSRRYEMQLHSYYGWPFYWHAAAMNPTGPWPIPPEGTNHRGLRRAAERNDEPNLRSERQVLGYRIQARDGEIGRVDDFVLDDEEWNFRYLVVNTRNWLPGRKVLVAPLWAEKIRWTEHSVFLDLTRQEVRDSPEYDPGAPVNRRYEERLYDFYGRPKYWLTDKVSSRSKN